MKIQNNVSATDINQGSKHTLFVEGDDDCEYIQRLISNHTETSVRVRGMQNCFYIKSVAEALHPINPEYYFLVDRDYHTDEYVDSTWQNFPEPEKSNLLIWKKHEIENYFLSPELLSKSQFYQRESIRPLESAITKAAQNRFYLEALNRVIIDCREIFRLNWIQLITNPELVPDLQTAKNKLIGMNEFADQSQRFTGFIMSLEYKLEQTVNILSGDSPSLKIGKGEWMNLMPGKQILNIVISSNLFKVKSRDGKIIQGEEKLRMIIIDLIQTLSVDDFPVDFIELCSHITRISKS